MKYLNNLFPKKKVQVSLFIVGAQKAGTSALYNYLIKHPKMEGGAMKEINFFNHEEKYAQGIEWYHKKFKKASFFESNFVYVDATPQYLNTKGVAEKIYNYNPKAKIVILLREPVSRAFSAWNMYKQFSELSDEKKVILTKNHIKEKFKKQFKDLINEQPFPSFEEFVDNELEGDRLKSCYPAVLERGIYIDQITPYYQLFGSDNIMICESEYFKHNKLQVTNNLLSLLGLNGLNVSAENLKASHVRSYEKSIDSAVGEKLRTFYHPYNERLFDLIGNQFDW